jgi:hypothetical protein
MEVKVVKHSWRLGDSFIIELKQGEQYFTLDYEGTEADCQWMAKMFRKALKGHDDQIYRRRYGR